jgi:hypothetical protein
VTAQNVTAEPFFTVQKDKIKRYATAIVIAVVKITLSIPEYLNVIVAFVINSERFVEKGYARG